MATIVYLDVEDEITSAATRIRTATEPRVALVLPFGSRLATSRINFRLLAREAMVNGRRLDLIAPDASARALAASAGLPVFGSVAEYEDALAAPAGSPHEGPGDDAAGGPAGVAPGAGAAAGVAGASTGATARHEERTGGPRAGTDAGPADAPDVEAMPVGRDARRGEPRVVRARRLPQVRTGMLAGFGLLAVAVLVAGIAGYVFLPAAQITVTPRIETIGPISFTVRADPAATSVDEANRVIPAMTLSVPVRSSGEFPATGKRVEEAKATGGVRWTNCDFLAAYSIPKGTIVKTESGIAFTTDEAVLLPQAQVSGTPPNLTVRCQTSEVSVTASKAGTDGNVAAGAIRVIPARYNRAVISVTNGAPTTGGTHDEFPQVAQKDVDAAIEQLRKDLDEQFATAIQGGAGAPPGTTVFPDTAALGDPATSVDPATLVGQEVESFSLEMAAGGTVLAVDSSPVETIAADRLQGSISPGHELVPGSISITVGDGSVAGGLIVFPVEGSAKQVLPLDAAALRRQVLGLGRQEAADLLGAYGTVDITLWPDWVSSVPSLDQRVTLDVAPPVDETPSATPSAEPFASPSAEPASEPVPSG